MKILRFYIVLFFVSFFSTIGNSQKELPAAFMMGEYGLESDKLGLDCKAILLEVCLDSMDLAYQTWLEMLVDMESMAKKINIDLRGVKVWMNVYWNEDGTVQHIVYHPKPNCRNLDFEELTAFFTTFVNRYDAGLQYKECYSHYGSVTFPTFAELYLRTSKN